MVFASLVALFLFNKHKPWIETTYHGIVTENDDKVLLDPPLIALDKDAPLRYAGEICGFRIHGQNVPFEAVVLDKSTGEGVIRAKDKLDCELQKEHTFTIQAYDCGEGPDGANMKKSHKATVHIQVNDINEYSPVFKEKSYKATVIEGKKYDSILKVEAVDADCSFQFSQICSYEIVTPDVPFTVDKDVLRLNMLLISLLSFTFSPSIHLSFSGFNKRIEYEPGTGSLALFPSMHLETCEEPITSIQANIELETNHIGKGCDRDTYSEKSLHKLCGASAGTVELLPAPSSSANWTVGLPTDNGHDSDQVFEFNGTQAIKVPEGVVSTSLKEPFTVSVWMRHGPGAREKETILCNSDKTEMNRHHYSLYVHNCHLILLLRQDPAETENYKPAEFHWKLDQVCDKEWHHYVLNVEFPSVALFVDGATFEPFLVTEDYPLHSSKIDMQLTIGACWQGGNARMSQFFRGNLAGLMIRSGKLENKKVIDCLYTCKEGLDVQLPEEVASAVKVAFNPNQSSLTVEGDDIEAFDKVMQHISYLNSRQFPTPGIRHLRVSTTVKCFNEETCILVPEAAGYVMVLQPEEPKISLSGIDHFARGAAEFESPEGVTLFPELRIVSTITREVEAETEPEATEATEGAEDDPTVQETVVSEEIMHNLDTCEVTALGDELDGEHETLEVDQAQVQQRGLEMTSSNLGLVMTGVNTMANYEQVLHLIRYKNWHTEALFDRKFKLFCSELNGRYISNDFKVEVNVIHTANPMDHANNAMVQPNFISPVHHASVDLSGHNLVNAHQASVVPSAATIVIVVCVSFLVFMIILGVFRIRSAHQRTMRDTEGGKENEMDWDDSALTITVNPMEVISYQLNHLEESEEGEEEDDITSAESESSEDEEAGEPEDQQGASRQQQLEWDDSTLTY
uniref:Calsyntenin-1 n=1 Tax=Salmo trutta TaxID=8032 RepID=A0A674CJL8_SALTR